MTRRLRIRAWATGTLLLAAVVGCSSNSSTVPPPSPSQSSITSTQATITPAASEAEQAVRRYYEVLDHIRTDPSVPVASLSEVAIGAQLTATTHLVNAERTRRERQTGSTVVDAQKTNIVSAETVLVDVCWNVTNVVILDGSGHSVVTRSRQNVGWTQFVVTNGTGSANGWRIESGQNLKQSPCTRS
jgi:hypothetical protein